MNQKYSIVKAAILFMCFAMAGCRKNSVSENVMAENISRQELSAWAAWYKKNIPNGPALLLEQTRKTYVNGEMLLEVPVSSGGGGFYFIKRTKIEVAFIRKVIVDDGAGNGKNGFVELINMNSLKYRKINFGDAPQKKKQDGLLSIGINGKEPVKLTVSDYYGSWFGALLHCIGNYIIAIPRRGDDGGWDCYGIGTGNGSGDDDTPGRMEDPGSPGGGPIDWGSWFQSNFPPSATGGMFGDQWLPYSGLGGTLQDFYSDFGVPVNPEDLMAYGKIDELATPPYTWDDDWDGETFDDPNPTLEPFIEFDPQDNYENLYPKFTAVAKNLKQFVKDNPKVLNALKKWSGFSKTQIMEKLTFRQGTGPKIKIADIGSNYGRYNHKDFPNIIKIDPDTVNELETTTKQHTKETIAFLLAVTILHEFCHFGENVNQLKNTGRFKFKEAGDEFELDAFDVYINRNSAGQLYIRFKKVP